MMTGGTVRNYFASTLYLVDKKNKMLAELVYSEKQGWGLNPFSSSKMGKNGRFYDNVK